MTYDVENFDTDLFDDEQQARQMEQELWEIELDLAAERLEQEEYYYAKNMRPGKL